MTKYLLLFRNGMPEQNEMDNYLRSWDTWIGRIAQEGKFDSGLPFGPKAKVISGKDKIISDFQMKPGDIDGYIIIKAESLEKAIEIAKQSPNLENGGTVEVRSTIPPPQ